MHVDLHCHTTASDGLLSPHDILQRAFENKLDILAITDHDTLDGYFEAKAYLDKTKLPLKLIPGVEISCRWREFEIHILGLNVNPDHPPFQELIAGQKQRRIQRAEKIAAILEKRGFDKPLERTQALAGSGALTRAHFALYLVEQGVATTQGEVFKHYLAKGKTGYVDFEWPSLQTVVQSIQAAGGKAVIAHPMRYNFTSRRTRKLIQEFKSYQGIGLEVAISQQTTRERYTLTQWAQEFNLEASCGSDFHRPSTWRDLGKNLDLSKNLVPIWHDF